MNFEFLVFVPLLIPFRHFYSPHTLLQLIFLYVVVFLQEQSGPPLSDRVNAPPVSDESNGNGNNPVGNQVNAPPVNIIWLNGMYIY
jgi:hypothetical protein